MTPDQRIANDLALIFLALAVLATVVNYVIHIEVDEASYCAERVRTSISPYQRKLLIGSDTFTPSYDEVKNWCNHNQLTWERSLKSSKSFPEFPSTPDMIQ
jgi:hypothetical protein|tara:strand:+ start:220 stop:522 length:303 start_codon:yes stop_codon:yes gene_type:complete